MQIDPKDLGPIGVVKSIVNAGLITGAVGIVLTWPGEFTSATSIGGLAIVAFGACAIVEWVFIGHHREIADQVKTAENIRNSSEMNAIREQGKVYEKGIQAVQWIYVRWIAAARELERQKKMVAPMLPTDTEGKIVDIPDYAILPLDHNPPAMDRIPELSVLVSVPKRTSNP